MIDHLREDQATDKGVKYLEQVASEHQDSVHRLVHGPSPFDKELIDVKFDGRKFELTTPLGFSKQLGVTDTEDVSYVTSPYLPDDLAGSEHNFETQAMSGPISVQWTQRSLRF